ncbi:MAG: Hsp20/alpha crystallin family protein [Devosia sp.]|jgi:HSP20 family protein|nr:Hsp20/alpha crystallin family protein [Devosiaceae bacterium]
MAETATKLPIKNENGNKPAPAGNWAPFDHLRREIDRLFDNFGFGTRPPLTSLFDVNLQWPSADWAIPPATDVAEKDNEYEITAELPGLAEKDIELKLANGVLTLRGEKKAEKEERKKDYYLSERRYGSFMRSFQIPEDVDADKIAATFAKGVLTIRLPKSAQAQQNVKKIDVKAA